MNLRLAYARSLIRPDMRELSYFVEYDYELGGEYTSTFIQTTRINHYDFRYEWYPGPGEIMSVSTFYKYFQNPMEIFRLSNSLNIYELRNDHSARVFGLEAEVRKSLAFTKVPVIKNLMLYGNFTAIRSSVRTQSTAIVPGANDMSVWKIIPDSAGYKSRPLSGLSNYVANAGIYYDTKYFGAALLYNYTSNKLQVLTIGESGSEEGQYEKTPGRFDAQLRTTMLKGKLELRFNIRNLNNIYSTVYQNSYTEAEQAEIKEKGKIPLKWLLYDKGKDLDILILKPYKTFSLSAAYRF
jgi:outer membrane receptor protein involved in Fe transport